MTQDAPALLCSLSESHELGAGIASRAGVTVLPLEERLFEEGEFKLRPLDSVRGRTVFVVQSLAGSADAACDDIASVITTDSAGQSVTPGNRLTELHVAPLFAEAVSRMIAGVPLAPLLDRWPPIGD